MAFVAAKIFTHIGLLTWSVLLGAVASNTNLLPAQVRPGVGVITKRLLRGGLVLLGFSLSLGALAALGPGLLLLVILTVAVTLAVTYGLGVRLGLGSPRSLLIATGFAICGASAIAAMKENANADEDDLAMAISLVTICGTVAMVTLPLLQTPLGLTDSQLGMWAGASVHEVGQVVAAAVPAGQVAVGLAVTVKLARVLMLAPAVAVVSLVARRAGRREGVVRDSKLPPPVPLFVLGFLVCAAIRSTGLLGPEVLGVIDIAKDLALSGALFGMGTAVHLRSLLRNSGPAVVLSLSSTLLIAAVSLTGIVLLT
jgi:uncharacterized integral membrane protein (TIGR00698 family)